MRRFAGVVVVGLAAALAPAARAQDRRLEERAISVDAMSTGAAVRTFNVLLAEERAVAAALIAVD